ncbi:MAG: serine hydrolase, partial [Actinobacteria bacterium]|nr:serine hydrolase [Actinomycetota bacterium]
SMGWRILCINPRGSDGYGEDFWRALIDKGWGHSDEQDFICAISALVDEGVVDPERIAVTGYSYGGWMTCWLTSRTELFAAAAAGGCISNVASFTGTSDAGWYLRAIELASPKYDRDELALRSAIDHVDSVATPTLILHGLDDDRCPVGQAEEWFTALRARDVTTELVLYPDAGHLFVVSGKPSHRIDYCRRVHEWVTRHASEPRPPRGNRTLAQRLRGFESWFQATISRHGVPGAAVAVFQGGETLETATGFLNVETRIPATVDSLFQIGSITKVYTTTLIMQLVDRGLLDLDAPVAEVLPGFRVADRDATERVTTRHLVTHTHGIQGDHFPDTGRGQDAIERYVETCAELGQVHPAGAMMSYGNSGFVIAGRVIEVVTGMSWHAALRELLVEPLGLGHTITFPEDAMRYRVAHGHSLSPDAPPVLAGSWMLPWSVAPAGLICATARDVTSFARMHLEEGLAPDGEQALSAGSVKAMQEEQVALPFAFAGPTHVGLGWGLARWDGVKVLSHDGGTLGQQAYLRVVPERNLAIALVTNSGGAPGLPREVAGKLFGELAGISIPPPTEPVPDDTPVDHARYTGNYERASQRIEVVERDGQLVAKFIVTGPLAEMIPDPVEEYELLPAGDELFVYRGDGSTSWTPLRFYELDDGTRYLHAGGRAT